LHESTSRFAKSGTENINGSFASDLRVSIERNVRHLFGWIEESILRCLSEEETGWGVGEEPIIDGGREETNLGEDILKQSDVDRDEESVGGLEIF
jgi:hypothetical protein